MYIGRCWVKTPFGVNYEDQQVTSAKFVVKMDEQRRIEIERSLVEATLGVEFSKGETLRFWALIGARRQLQVLAPGNELAKTRDRIEAGSLDEHPTWDSAGDERTDLMRRMTSLIGISCACEPKRGKLRLTVDAEAEHLGLVQPRAEMVVFASGGILELWRHVAWVEYSTTLDPRELAARVKEAFGENS